MSQADIPSYEAAMEELQQIVAALQEETVRIDDLSANVKRAAELIQYCKTKLRTTSEEMENLF
ncbi:MAG: exodeoxyribonuclease VII small subunit [Bacteroidota bacterium]